MSTEKEKTAQSAVKNLGGRPSIYNDAIGLALCEQIALGKSLRSICKADDMPSVAAVINWLADGKHETFVLQYMRAREQQADAYFEEAIEIADDGVNDTYVVDGKTFTNQDVIARSRLRVDTRKWAAGKLAPKKYGEKITQDINATITTLTPEKTDERIKMLLDKAGNGD